MDETLYSFGAWLRRRRAALRLRQAEVAERVGCSPVLIRKIEADERRPSALIAERIAEAIAVPRERRALFIAVARGDRSATTLDAPEDTGPAAAPLTPGNLAAPLLSLVGREPITAELERALGGARLITLVGPPGIGKTSLAHAAAAASAPRYRDGVWLARLAPLPHPRLVADELARVLGVDPRGRPALVAVCEHLRPRRALIILDNFEHVLDAAAAVAQLLEAAPHLTLLVTSRAPLRLAAERLISVPPLPEEAGAALFAQRARAADPAQGVDEQAAPVRAIVRRLDGIPLAIELAAARTRIFTPAELLRRLESSGIAELSGGWRDAPARQQTLSAAIRWSYDLLSPSEQALFRTLGVCAGGWDVGDAQALCGAALGADGVVAGLEALIDHHLIERLAGARRPGRLQMLELIRQFALARLAEHGELEPARARHAEHFLGLAQRAAAQLRGPGQIDALDTLSDAHENLRATLIWAGEAPGRAEAAMQLGVALQYFWVVRGHTGEGVAWLSGIIERAPEQSASYPHALNALGWVTAFADCGPAVAIYRRSLALAEQRGDMVALADAHFGLGSDTLAFTDRAAALVHLARALELYRRLGDRAGESWALAYQARWLPDLAQAEQRGALALQRVQADGDLKGQMLAHTYLAERVRADGRTAEAQRHLNTVVDLAHQIGDLLGEAIAIALLAECAHDLGDTPGALEMMASARTRFRMVSDTMSVLNTTHIQIEMRGGQCERAELAEALALIPQVSLDPVAARLLSVGADLLLREGRPAAAAEGLAAVQAALAASETALCHMDSDALRTALDSAQRALDGDALRGALDGARRGLDGGAFESACARGARRTLSEAATAMLAAVEGGAQRERGGRAG